MRILLLILATAFCPSTLIAQSERSFPLEPPPNWVVEQVVDLERMPAEEALHDGVYYLLVDNQVRVTDAGEARFTSIAIKVLDESGVDYAGRFSVDFDPTFESVAIHGIDVIRDGVPASRYDPARLQVLQRETEMEARLYDGRLTLTLVIEDLRVGDVVAYSYTRSGANPIFDGMYSDAFYTEWSAPVDQLRIRLLWPEQRSLHVKSVGLAPEPQKTIADGVVEYTWQLERLPAKLHDGDTPAWFDPYARVQLSEWPSWQAVVDWASPLYSADPAALRTEANTLSAASDDPANRLVAALRFVQDDIRYVAFEMGRGSHEPRKPAQTLRQRFGDCKDKSLLLVSLLEALGIRAAPVLVHSTRNHTLDDWLPTPLAFDHAIVVAYLDGQEIWIDPSRGFQRGDLAHLHQPDFGRALVLAAGSSALVAMSPPGYSEPTRVINEVFDLSAGVGKSAPYVIRSVHRGESADQMRAWRSSQSGEEIDKAYLNYYASNYPGIELVESVRFEDDEERNEISVTERYRVDSLWQRDEALGVYAAHFVPQETIDAVQLPATSIRTMPLAVLHPFHQVHQIELKLPEDWDLDPSNETFDNDAVSMAYRIDYSDDKLRLRYSIRSKADHVVPASTPAYLKDVESFHEILGYRLTDPAAKSINWSLLTIAVFSFVIGAFIARRVYLYDPREGPLAVPENQRLKGFGGWLLLLALGVFTTPVRMLVEVFQTYAPIDAATWSMLTSPTGDGYHPMWAPLIIFEVTGNSVFLAIALLLPVLFLTRRRSFPSVYRVFLLANLLFLLIDAWLASFIPDVEQAGEELAELVRTLVVSIGWFLYLGASRRVRATFTRRRVATAEITGNDLTSETANALE